MATNLTPSQIIDIAKISQYLAGDDVAQGTLWGTRLIPTSDRILYMERKAVEWMYNLDPTNSTLRLTSNYLYSLCRGYNLRAQAISGGGGSVSPVAPVSLPAPIEFVVDAASSYMIEGQSTKTISSFIGFNIILSRNNVIQTQVNTAGSYFSWNRVTGDLVIVGAAALDELISINPI